MAYLPDITPELFMVESSKGTLTTRCVFTYYTTAPYYVYEEGHIDESTFTEHEYYCKLFSRGIVSGKTLSST